MFVSRGGKYKTYSSRPKTAKENKDHGRLAFYWSNKHSEHYNSTTVAVTVGGGGGSDGLRKELCINQSGSAALPY